MAKNVKKVSDKLAKVNDSFTINMYDNGFMIEIGGQTKNDDWSTAKILVSEINDLLEIIKEVAEMERN